MSFIIFYANYAKHSYTGGHRGCDCMVVGFTTACAIITKIVCLNPVHG